MHSSLVRASWVRGRRVVRNSAMRAGLCAVSAAVASFAGAVTARADLSGFGTFAPVNLNTTSSTAGIGYTGSTSFETTNGQGNEWVSGFSSAPQLITSFDATYTYVITGAADGGSFCIQNTAAGTAADGTSVNGGGGGGFAGMGTHSFALQFEFYNSTPGSANNVEDGPAYNGGSPAYTYWYNLPNQGQSYAGTGGATNLPILNSGDQIQFNLSYFNGTLTENVVDLTRNVGATHIMTGINLASVLGSNSGYVGFTGGTGGSPSVQTVSNFTFVSNKTFSPVSISGGFNEKGIVPVGGSLSSITATQDNGTKLGNDTWYEKGFNTAAPTTGLPASGSTFTSQADSAHVFQMQTYSSNDVVLLASAATNSGPTSATMTFTSQTQPYNALSFLTASGNGPNVVGLTINYADGHPSTTGLSFLSPDWFSGSPSAWTANGRYSGNFDNVNSGNPNLFAEDVVLPDNTDPISSITFSFLGGNRSPTGNIFIFAVSGEAGAAGPVVTYTGSSAGTPSYNWNTVGTNQNFNGMSGSTAVAVAYVQGDQAFFDDTSPTASHHVTLAANLNASSWNVNTSTGYVFSGAGMNGTGGLSVNTTGGTGTVVLANSNTYSGATSVGGGLLQMNSSSAIASNVINVLAGATMNVSSGAQLTGSAIALTNSGTFNDFNPALNLASLTGASTGLVNLNGTALTVGATNYSGTIGGTSGSILFTGAGTFSGTITDGTSSPIAVTINGSSGTLIFSNSNTYSGGTYLAGGALEIASAASLGTGPLVLEGGAIGAYAPDVNLPNNISGSALVVVNGSNVLELSGNNTFTGPIVIQGTSGTSLGGTLQIDSAGALGNATSIIVGSGGTFNVNYATGTPAGVGDTLQISGNGVYLYNATTGYNGSSGALRGGDNLAVIWGGNINVSGPSSIVPGASTSAVATLTLTGSISGTGPLLFTGNPNDTYSGATTIVAPSAGNTNTYTGETQLMGEPNPTAGTTTLQLGANNALSTASGLNIIAGKTAQNVNFDMAGYNQSIAYLSGTAQSGYSIINSGSTQSILTINNGTGSISTSSSTAINGNIAIVKAGAGNQTLAGNSAYSGGTTVAAGTLSVGSSTALGSGTVFLGGGTLAFPASSLAGFSTYVLNGSATLNGSSINVTNNVPHTWGSAFTSTKATINLTQGFTATYTMNLNAANTGYVADGAGFVLQDDPNGPSALGGGGGAIGWQGIQNTFIAGFETYGYDFGNGGANDTEFGTNGTFNQVSTSGCSLTSQSVLVNLSYDGSTITETLTGLGTQGGTYTTTYAVNLASVLGSNMAYVGFTGGCGDGSATQTFSNFSMTGAATSASTIANPVVANAGTSSVISVAVNPGSNTQSLTSLTLNNGSSVKLTTLAGSTGILVLTTPSLSIASANGSFTGQLDIGSADLDLPGASLATITSMVKQGYAGGTWTGKGITSSSAANDSSHLTAVGVIVNDNPLQPGTPLYGTNGGLASSFDGDTTVADGDILVKYTYYGDANLDGAVDGTDYALVDATYLAENFVDDVATNPISGWYNGDFNYDGVVDGSDYTLMDNAFNQQGDSLGVNPAALTATATAQVGGSAVPEPTSLGLLAVGSVALLGRRRRR